MLDRADLPGVSVGAPPPRGHRRVVRASFAAGSGPSGVGHEGLRRPAARGPTGAGVRHRVVESARTPAPPCGPLARRAAGNRGAR